MSTDRNRAPGFYWVRFEGALIVAEYTSDINCSGEYLHWHIPSSHGCYLDSEVCELVSPTKLIPPVGVSVPVDHMEETDTFDWQAALGVSARG